MEPEVRGTSGCRYLCSLGRADYYAENRKYIRSKMAEI